MKRKKYFWFTGNITDLLSFFFFLMGNFNLTFFNSQSIAICKYAPNFSDFDLIKKGFELFDNRK